jgi:hypothetical protein
MISDVGTFPIGTILPIEEKEEQILRTGIDAFVQIQKCLLRCRQATLNDSFLPLKLAFSKPLSDFFAGGGELVCVVENNEALQLDSHRDDH